MKRLILGIMISLTVAALAGALVPQYINYQGILRDSAGNLEDGTFSMIFKIYDAETSGTAVFNAAGSTTSVPVSNGLYSVRLGPVDSSIFDGSDLWLEVTVGSDTLSPRLRINSVAYAITADLAETATNANYAAVSGTATNAASATNASAVGGYLVSPSPDSNKLYPLDADGKISGVSVSAEAVGSPFALFVGGKMGGVSTEGASYGPCGMGSISGSDQTTITNSLVTANSIILLTPKFSGVGANYKWLKVKSITPGTNFIVETFDGVAPIGAQEFYYLIIN